MAATVSARKAAELMGVNERTVRRWIHRGRLPAVRSGNDGRELEIDVDALAALRKPAAPITLVPRQSGEIRYTQHEVDPLINGHPLSELVRLVRDQVLEANARADAAIHRAETHAAEAARWKARAEALEQQLRRPWWAALVGH